MIKCPNCGSAAQLRTATPMYYEDGVWKYQKKCSCGCVVIVRDTDKIDKIEYPKRVKRGRVLLKEWLKTFHKPIDK